MADIERDILKAAVVERHRGTGNVGLGLVRGFGLKRGAIASSYAHDSHNIVVVGASDQDMLAAVRHLESLQGGLTVVLDGEPLASVPLPIAGLMSAEAVETVSAQCEDVEAAAASLGVTVQAPFAVLSFLALPVIPELRVTDKGLVDVLSRSIIDVRASDSLAISESKGG